MWGYTYTFAVKKSFALRGQLFGLVNVSVLMAAKRKACSVKLPHSAIPLELNKMALLSLLKKPKLRVLR